MTASIVTVYEKKNRYFSSYTAVEYTPEDVRKNASLNTRHYAKITTTEHPKGVYIDLSTMFQEQPVGQTLTWADFYTLLTPAMIDSYTVSGTGLSTETGTYKQVLNVQPFSMTEFDISYCDINDPSKTNVYSRRFDLPDLVISKKNASAKSVADIHLENCIVSINGVISKANIYNDKLYITDGAKNLWDINKQTSINILMSDFTPLGGIERLPLSKCKLTYKTKNTEDETTTPDVLYSDIIIELPSTYDLNNYTVMLCIAGKCQFPDEITIENKRVIRISPYKLSIPTRLLNLSSVQAAYMSDSSIVATPVTASEYVRTLGKTTMSDTYDMIYLIKQPKISVKRAKLIRELGWLTKYGTTSPGICIRTSDSSWMSYTTAEYNEMYYHCGVKWPHNFVQLTSNDEAEQYCIKELDSLNTEEYFRDHLLSSYEMVYLTY